MGTTNRSSDIIYIDMLLSHPREQAGVLWGRQIGHQISYI